MKLKDIKLLSSILGSFKMEFRKIFLKDNTKGNLYIITALLFLIISFSFLFLAIIGLMINTNFEIYPSGALYSTVRIKDFKHKK